MLTRLFRHPWGWATVAPLVCAVHCAFTPIVVLAAPSLAPGEAVEWALLGITVAVGSVALWSGVRAHDDLRPVVPVTVGLGLWALSLGHAFRPVPEEITTVMATLVVAGGLFWNSRLHCARKAAACQACAAEAQETRHEAAPDGGLVAPADRAGIPVSLTSRSAARGVSTPAASTPASTAAGTPAPRSA